MKGGRVVWSGDLHRNLALEPVRQRRAIIAAANYAAPQIEAFMKANAPWTDRTGNARSGLATRVQVNGNLCAIVLYHSVAYGPYLELRWNGKFSIIPAGMQMGGPLWMEAIARLMFVGGAM